MTNPSVLPPAAPAGYTISDSASLVAFSDSASHAGPIRIPYLRDAKRKGKKLIAVTCYDATFARLVDSAGIDIVLVGDSLGNVIQGHHTTLPVTVDHIIYHCAAVQRGLQRAHLVADMPFGSYRTLDIALTNGHRMLAEGFAHAVKLEGGIEIAPLVQALVQAGIPVMGHIGLTPQAVHAMGGHRVQGRGKEARARLLADATALQAAGCYALVLEGLPADLGRAVTQSLDIPTIGAGPDCDGQILVLYDLLGLNPEFSPKFLKHFAEVGLQVRAALQQYQTEVRSGSFPGPEHSYQDPVLAAEMAADAAKAAAHG
jgi:3-methyl-2-oxobutanoate hydroxymethyltransferase